MISSLINIDIHSESVEPFQGILGQATRSILSIFPCLYQFQIEEVKMSVHSMYKGLENMKNVLGEGDTLLEGMEVDRSSMVSVS